MVSFAEKNLKGKEHRFVESFFALPVIIPFLLTFLSLSLFFNVSCGERKEIEKKEDFSTGLANRDPRISEGIKYIESEDFGNAIKFFKKFSKENPEHCGYLIGLPLAQIQRYLSKISAIVSFIVGVYGGSESEEESSSPKFSTKKGDKVGRRLREKQPYGSCDQSIDKLIRDFTSDLYTETKEGLMLIEKAIERRCELDIEYPLSLSVGPNFFLRLILYGRMGDTELRFLSYFGYSVLTLANLILSHDYSADLVGILANIKKLDTSNITGILRTLAILVEGCPKTLAFHEDYKKYLPEVPTWIVRSIDYSTTFLESLEMRNGQKGYIITFSDGSGEGKLGYDTETVSLSTTPDMITLQVKGQVVVGSLRGKLKSIKIKVPYLISFKFIEEAKKLIAKIKDIVENRKRGCPENCISIADINFVLEALDTAKFDDFARLDIMRYFENPKPLRELLPYWFKNPRFKRWEFMIEAEVPGSRQDLTYYLFNYDAPHFTYPPVITFYGKTISDFAIPPDCVHVKDVPLNWILIPYLMFQDPTLAGMLYIRLKDTFVIRCSNIDDEYNRDEWSPANLYMVNKTIAIITRKAGSIVNPLTKLILESVEIEK